MLSEALRCCQNFSEAHLKMPSNAFRNPHTASKAVRSLLKPSEAPRTARRSLILHLVLGPCRASPSIALNILTKFLRRKIRMVFALRGARTPRKRASFRTRGLKDFAALRSRRPLCVRVDQVPAGAPHRLEPHGAARQSRPRRGQGPGLPPTSRSHTRSLCSVIFD